MVKLHIYVCFPLSSTDVGLAILSDLEEMRLWKKDFDKARKAGPLLTFSVAFFASEWDDVILESLKSIVNSGDRFRDRVIGPYCSILILSDSPHCEYNIDLRLIEMLARIDTSSLYCEFEYIERCFDEDPPPPPAP